MRTFVGFGLGPIQTAVFLAEAQRSGAFTRLVVAEIRPDVVAAVRRAGSVTLNIAHPDRVEVRSVGPVEILDPREPADREALVEAIAAADEMATALPGVAAYEAGGVAAVLADGLRRKADRRGPPAILYAGENHPAAADHLAGAVRRALRPTEWRAAERRMQVLDTVIGRMSGAPEEPGAAVPIAPGLARAFLVEAEAHVSVGRVRRPEEGAGGLDPDWAGYRRGLAAFLERPDLRPYAEAKLYGHNAGHALAAYLAHLLGFGQMDALRRRPDILALVREAIAVESGRPLAARYGGVDPLFTAEGFRAHAEELVARMTNPHLRDAVARVGRDPARKLAWDDRLVGAMRRALAGGLSPRRYALGAAAALEALGVPADRHGAWLRAAWAPATPEPGESGQVLEHIAAAAAALSRWRARAFPALEVS